MQNRWGILFDLLLTLADGRRESYMYNSNINAISFAWDEAKERSNRAKHGISFNEAATSFLDEYARVIFDEEHSFDESRYVLFRAELVCSLVGRLSCFREHDNVIRIISARRATKREELEYRRFRREG